MQFLQPQLISVSSPAGAGARNALSVSPLSWSVATSYQIDTAHLIGNGTLTPRSVLIDNTQCPLAVAIMTSGAVPQSFSVAPGEAGVYPIVSPGPTLITFSTATLTPNAATRVTVLDFELSYNTWAGASTVAQLVSDQTLIAAARQNAGATSLSVVDSVSEGQLATIATALAGTLAVADVTARATLATIATALAGTLAVKDTATETSTALLASSGGGAMQAVPAGTTNGTALPFTRQVRFYLKASDSVTFTITAAQPSAAPASTFQLTGSVTGPNWDETLSGQTVYVVAISGTPLMRGY